MIQGDDRRLVLRLPSHCAREAGIGYAVHVPPPGTATPNVYRTDLATLRFLAAARHLALLTDSNGASLRYELCRDRRAELGGFVRHMSAD